MAARGAGYRIADWTNKNVFMTSFDDLTAPSYQHDTNVAHTPMDTVAEEGQLKEINPSSDPHAP